MLSIVLLVAGAFLLPVEAGASTYPHLSHDPKTIAGCTMWWDNFGERSCESVRTSWQVSPETFHRWNPSITLDCQNWLSYSYCIDVQSKDPPLTIPTPTTTSAPTPKPTLPTIWSYLGCYQDYPNHHPIANHSTLSSGQDLTRAKCQAACLKDGYNRAGMKAGTECWCAAYIVGDWASSQSDCNIPCPGNSSETCGGTNVFDIFQGQLAPPESDTTTTVRTTTAITTSATTHSSLPLPTQTSGWDTLGCYKDTFPANQRTLDNQVATDGQLTVESCRDLCFAKQYIYSGMEDGRECWCGNTIQSSNANIEVALTDCNKSCPGNADKKCGASGRILLSKYIPPTTPAWVSMGCFKDTFPTNARTLSDQVSVDGQLTKESCQAQCLAKKYTYSGVEDGRECWCGNVIQSSSSNILDDMANCNKPCPADSTEFCGGKAHIQLSQYIDPGRSHWQSLGCYKDTFPSHARTLKDQVSTDGQLTIQSCRDQCLAKNYVYSGVEDGRECWCGNEIQDSGDNVIADESSCTKTCPADKNQNCGAGGFINLSKYVSSNTIWIPLGCYGEESPRILRNKVDVAGGDGNNSRQNCFRACEQGGWLYAGVENANECWCDNLINPPGKLASDGW